METRKFYKKRWKYLLGAALAASLTFASVAPTYAGTITIHPGEYTSKEVGDRFTAYQIFSGTANDPENPHSLTGIEWSEEIDHDGFVAALKEEPLMGLMFKFAYEDWQNDQNENKDSEAEMVAKFLSSHSFWAQSFARLFAENKLTSTHKSVIEGDNWVIKDVPDGYYLIVDTVAEQTNESASSYILDVVGDEEIKMKSTIPTVDKTVEDTQKGNIEENYKAFEFTLTGTLPENYDEYTTYKYVFKDTLPAGLSFVEESVHVEINGQEIGSDKYQVACEPQDNEGTSAQQNLTITFEDLKTITETKVTAESTVVVTYQAKLNKYAVAGSEGNENTVYLEFSNDPYNEQMGQTTPDTTKTYEYEIDVTKYNGSAEEKTPLQGAEFKLKNAENKYAVLEQVGDTWVLKSWAETEGEGTTVTTGEDGKLKIKGLGNGSYTLHESKAPDGFDLMEDVTFTLDGSVSEEGVLQNVTATMTGTRDDASVKDENSDGIIDVELTNYESSVLPHTGGAGTTALYIISITVGIAGVAGLTVAFRKREKKNN